MPGLASDYSSLKLLYERNADHLLRDVWRIDQGDEAKPGARRHSKLFSCDKEVREMRQATSKAAAGSSANWRRIFPGIAGLALLAGVTAAHAESTGIATCDEFLTKYDSCVAAKVPAEQRATYKAQIDQMRKTWIDLSKNPSTKATMETTCKQTMDATKASLTSLGCSF
ncbi:hypothetical protein NLM33_02875 [Bradyrhizobium sp. CCGUVB1N3]|uniref:hypothetical protein n=1 Tax=Bradyrhizobium sp. CCGUVB1N3 TaxID=2949629 RepID=UPI0020B3AF2F|nr:hypothetical protein [Bradyrhizobium sp. CCGUVB1N3]MCP3469269.1 hypothetical protein [Bradyrhizobium sp. CCGUVB1N3]